MNLISTLLMMMGLLAPTGDISMLGIKINDSKKSVDNIQLEVVAQDGNLIKYRTENGNDFSIALEEGKVVYMENDWLHDPKGSEPLFSNFSFGETSLEDIRNRFSTNGFAYKTRGPFTTDTDLIEFNCFDLDSKNNEVLVVVTKMPLHTDATKEDIASKLKLEALIIADQAYLDRLWGKKKVFDKNYKKLNPDKLISH